MWISRRALTAGLALSLLANLVLVGVLIGRYVTETRGPFLHGSHKLVVPSRVRDLPEPERTRYRGTTAEHRASIAAARQQVRAARERAQAALAAATFDRTQVTADLAALRDASVTLQAAVHDALVDAVEDLSPASRATLVEQAGARR